MSASAAPAAAEYELLFGPSDGISAVNFANHSDLLIVSSWDKGVRVHDAIENRMLQKYEHKGAVLDGCFSFDDTRTFSGGQDCNLMMCDLATASTSALGSHEKPIRCVVSSSTSPVVYTGSWDKHVSVWDYRAAQPRVGSHVQEGKVYSLALADRTADASQHKLVVATSDRRVVIYDVRMMDRAEQLRESALQHQTRCVRCFPDGTGFALSSVEGRVAIEYFDPSPAVQQRKYAFKCHRATINGVQTLYPVNALAFNPTYGTFATGGCDGLVNIWDGDQKKRICQYPAYPTSIAALDFNRAGTLLAVAASYTFEEGEKDHPPDVVFVRRVQDHEVRPKVAKK